MKKLLACLLALMMLPAAAFAQSFAYEWTIDMPEDALVNLVQTIGEAWPEMAESLGEADESMLRGAAKLVDGAQISLHVQDDWFQGNLRLRDADILGASLLTGDDAMHCQLDGLEGIALAMPMGADQAALDACMASLAAVDWTGLGAAADAVINEWLKTLPTAIESGSFAGEAYTGGVYRMTYQIDDRDLFVLMESLLHYEGLLDIPALDEMLSLCGLDMQLLLEEARTVAYDAAMENACTYLVHSVSDGQYLIGLSIVAYQMGQQVGTLSVGWQDEGFKVVLGYGYQGRNVYFAAESVGAYWSLQMVKDDALEGYTAAYQKAENVLLQLSGENKSNSGQATVKASLTGELLRNLNIGAEIFVDSSLSDMELSVKLSVNGKDMLTQLLRVDRAADKVAPDLTGLRVVEIREDGSMSENIDSEMQTYVTTLGIRLFKILPLELLTVDWGFSPMFQ